MSDSEMSNLTQQERNLVKEVLTRAWLSFHLNSETDHHEDNLGTFSPLSKEQVNSLANAINKI